MCFHRYSKWSEEKNIIIYTSNFFSSDYGESKTGHHGYVQTRTCKKCGKLQVRKIKL